MFKVQDHRYWRVVQQPTKWSLRCWFDNHEIKVTDVQATKVVVQCVRCQVIWHWVNELFYSNL